MAGSLTESPAARVGLSIGKNPIHSSVSGNGKTRVAGRKRSPFELAPSTLKKLTESLKDEWKCYRRRLRQCQQSFSEESVHDLRVEARRLMSLLDLLSPFANPTCVKRAHRALKCHLDTFDDLRDAQVQLASLKKLRKRYVGACQLYLHLGKCQPSLCQATQKKAKRMGHKPLGRLIKSWRKATHDWLDQNGPRLANPLLVRGVNAAFDRTRELRARINPEEPRSIHRTRIAFKKLRYMIEALEGHLPWAREPLFKRMRRYQGLMGNIQDGEVLLRVFEKFSCKEQLKACDVLPFTRELIRHRRQMIQQFLKNSWELMTFWPPMAVSQNDYSATSAKTGGKSAQRPRFATRATQSKSI